MAQPVPYVPATVFLSYQAQQPWFPGQQLDAEFNNIDTSITQIETNLKLIQRDDGALANLSVGYDQLNVTLQAALGNIPAIATIQALAVTIAAEGAAATVSQTASAASAATSTAQAVISTAQAVISTAQAVIATTQATNSATSATASALNATSITGVKFAFDTSTTMAAPATGGVRFNNATIASVTAIAFNALSADTGNPDVSAFLAIWGASTTAALRGTIIVRKLGTPATYAVFSITAAITNNTTWLQATVAYVGGNGALSAADQLSIQWARTGDAGAGTVAGLSTHGVVIATGATAIGNTLVLTNGQLVIGATGADPAAQTVSGDATLAASGALTLAASGVGAGGPTGSTSVVPVITYDAKGRLTTVTTATVTPAAIGAVSLTTTSQAFSGGVVLTEFDNGTKATAANYTPEPGNGPFQKVTHTGPAVTITASVNLGSIKLRVTNGASLPVITFSGFDKQLSSDPVTTTNTSQFDVYISIAGKKTYQIVALQ